MPDILLYNAFAKSTKSLRTDIGEPATISAALADPNYYTQWPTLIPKLTTANNLCVYDTSGYFRCGACCLWTVPAGATKVRFELWGAGSGSGAPNCCGHYPWGPNGAYASVIIDATVGCQYTLCAGCASATQQCCRSCNDVSGCKSFVTGHRLTNFCAEGGCGQYCTVMQYANPTSPNICRYQGTGQNLAGMCICGGWSMCFSSSCASCAPLLRAFVPTRTFYGTATGSTVYGYSSMASADCWDTNNSGCICSAPILLPNQSVSDIYCDSYTSNTCCGGRCFACSGFRQLPGLGGIWTHTAGGCTSVFGDYGRTGMVKVSWC